MAALKQPTIRVIAVIAEGVPESDTKQLIAYARANNKVKMFLMLQVVLISPSFRNTKINILDLMSIIQNAAYMNQMMSGARKTRTGSISRVIFIEIDFSMLNLQVVIGPATVGGIQAGAFKIGDTAGTIDNIIQCKLYRPGSVGFVSKSVSSLLFFSLILVVNLLLSTKFCS